jgi:hypothetical protein
MRGGKYSSHLRPYGMSDLTFTRGNIAHFSLNLPQYMRNKS